MSHPPALIIHGHFYQPPRENPWTGEVQREPSAAPFHNWNERIHGECYRANGWARVLDGDGAVTAIANNYQNLSFNFGPTLLSWLQLQHGDTYRRILAADRDSLRKHGHGNAIAQGYNHSILPLCNARDLRTQIHWGLREFASRYGRESESLWLPETACNDEVMEALIDAGLRYVLLAPRQAASVVEPDGTIRDVTDGSIDPREPYRYVDRRDPTRSIAVFFYDGGISQAIAFEGLLSSSRALIERFDMASSGEGSLVHVVTDGETYGHHFKFGDRCLAHALSTEAEQRGYWVTNYGALLDVHPPEKQVTLHLGDDGQGSSWSCEHGVGRWSRDCGCHTGGQPGYQQRWRKPLRAALDLLRDHASAHFEDACSDLADDPWALRDRYIDVVLGPPSVRPGFFAEHAPRATSSSQQQRLLALLESQRSSMVMYTSCGWFFNELSGLETVQVMRYAGQLLDQLAELGAKDIQPSFLDQLSEARSNLTAQGSGADIYHKQVAPSRVTSASVAAHISLSTMAIGIGASGSVAAYHYRIEALRRVRSGRLGVATACITLRHKLTDRQHCFGACAIHFGDTDLSCVLRPLSDPSTFEATAERIWQQVESGASLLSIMRVVEEELGPDDYGLSHILPPQQEAFSRALFAPMRERYAAHYELTFQESQQAIARFRDAGLPLPDELEVAAQLALSERFTRAVDALPIEPFERHAYDRAVEIVELARRYGCELPLDPVARQLEQALAAALRRVVSGDSDPQRGRSGSALARALQVLAVSERLGAPVDLQRPQEQVCRALREGLPASDELLRLVQQLGLSASLLQQRQSQD